MLKSKKIIIRTTDGGVRTVLANWELNDVETLRITFGEDMEHEIYRMVFQHIENDLRKNNIKLSEVKSITFEDYDGGDNKS
jgi:hypothetical protein